MLNYKLNISLYFIPLSLGNLNSSGQNVKYLKNHLNAALFERSPLLVAAVKFPLMVFNKFPLAFKPSFWKIFVPGGIRALVISAFSAAPESGSSEIEVLKLDRN